jgi:hypothetical protein
MEDSTLAATPESCQRRCQVGDSDDDILLHRSRVEAYKGVFALDVFWGAEFGAFE